MEANKKSMAGDWRANLSQESRQCMVNMIIGGTLEIYEEGNTHSINRRAISIEDECYLAATSQADYLMKISKKLLSIEKNIRNIERIYTAVSNACAVNQTSANPASKNPTAQREHAGVSDWQEQCYQKIQSMKELYYAQLIEFHQKFAQFLRQCEARRPPGKTTQQYESFKEIKMKIERHICVLQLSKPNISVRLVEYLPLIEKQIITMVTTPQQLHGLDNHGNQSPNLNLQSSGTSMQSFDGPVLQSTTQQEPTSNIDARDTTALEERAANNAATANIKVEDKTS